MHKERESSANNMLDSTLFRGIDSAADSEQNQRHETPRISMGVGGSHRMKTSEFFAAVRKDDLRRVAALLEENPSLANARNRGDSTLLSEQVWVNKQVVGMQPGDDRTGTALHFAAFRGNKTLAELLLDHGADVNAVAYENNHEMTTPVILAAWEGGLDVLRLLLERGANPNSRSSNGVTPLSTATRHGKQDRVELLRKFGAKE